MVLQMANALELNPVERFFQEIRKKIEGKANGVGVRPRIYGVGVTHQRLLVKRHEYPFPH